MSAPLTDGALISHSIVAVHRTPENAPRRRVCTHCTEEGCAALDEAVQHLAELAEQTKSLLAAGSASYGRA